jgi:uncharacterized membrane protein
MPTPPEQTTSEPIETVAPVRPSPYQQEWGYALILMVCKLFIAICLLVSIGSLLLGVFVMYNARGDEGGKAVGSVFSAFLYSILGASAFGFFSYVLRMLSDIEQHTFRAAQCLTTIVESDRKSVV